MEGYVNKHFEGTTINYIACLNVDYKSEREEAFQDLQLNVKGCKDVYDSFNEYCQPEVMDGQNQYQAEGHGLQVTSGLQGLGLQVWACRVLPPGDLWTERFRIAGLGF